MSSIALTDDGGISSQRLLGWGASALIHGGVVALLLYGVPISSEPPPAPEIMPLEMMALPAAPATDEAEAGPAMEQVSTVAPESTSATDVPPPPMALTTSEPITAAEPPPDAVVPPEPVPVQPVTPPDMVQAVQPDTQQAVEPDVIPLEAADIPPPPPAPPPPPVQARPPAPQPPAPRPAPRRPSPPTEATATQRTEAPAGAVTAAPAPAAAPRAAPSRAAGPPPSYLGRLSAALERAKRYPNRARLRRVEGLAHLHFTMRRDGTVVSWRIVRSTGDADLDEAVGEMIQRASPLPAAPPELEGDPISMTVPVNFNLR